MILRVLSRRLSDLKAIQRDSFNVWIQSRQKVYVKDTPLHQVLVPTEGQLLRIHSGTPPGTLRLQRGFLKADTAEATVSLFITGGDVIVGEKGVQISLDKAFDTKFAAEALAMTFVGAALVAFKM
jgi:hypothetical protein